MVSVPLLFTPTYVLLVATLLVSDGPLLANGGLPVLVRLLGNTFHILSSVPARHMLAQSLLSYDGWPKTKTDLFDLRPVLS